MFSRGIGTTFRNRFQSLRTGCLKSIPDIRAVPRLGTTFRNRSQSLLTSCLESIADVRFRPLPDIRAVPRARNHFPELISKSENGLFGIDSGLQSGSEALEPPTSPSIVWNHTLEQWVRSSIDIWQCVACQARHGSRSCAKFEASRRLWPGFLNVDCDIISVFTTTLVLPADYQIMILSNACAISLLPSSGS
jgi:hypothetical protein